MKKTLLPFSCFLLIISVQAQDYRYGKVSMQELAETAHPKYPEAAAAILNRDSWSHFEYKQNSGFVLITEVEERVKIYNAKGFDHATTITSLSKDGSDEERMSHIEGVTYTLVNGKVKEEKLRDDGVFKEETNKYNDKVTFTMPDISAGCVIEYKYELRSPFFGNVNEARFQEQIPVNYARAKYSFPEFFNYKIHSRGGHRVKIDESSRRRKITFAGQRTRPSGGFDSNGGGSYAAPRSIDYQENSYELTAEEVPPLKEESFTGNVDNYMTAIKFELSYVKFPDEPINYMASTWEDVTKNIYKSSSFGEEIKKRNYFDSELDALLKDASSAEEKAMKIFTFVKQKMVWNDFIGFYSQNGLRQAYKEGIGNTADINLMLVAMLKYAGLDADPVLLSTKDNGVPIFPTRSGFNYVVASVVIDGSRLLMDATSKLACPGVLDPRLLNWNGRIVREDGSSAWTDLTPSVAASESSIVNVDILPDFSVKGKVQNRFTGHDALRYRKSLLGLNEHEARSKLEGFNAGVELSEVSLGSLEMVYEPVSLSYSFDPINGLEEVGDKLYLNPMMHFATTINPFKAEARLYPIDFSYPRHKKFMITINIPEGYVVESIPEGVNASLVDDMGRFVYRISQTGNALQILCEEKITTALMGANYYEGLKEFFDMIVQKENEKIVLVKA